MNTTLTHRQQARAAKHLQELCRDFADFAERCSVELALLAVDDCLDIRTHYAPLDDSVDTYRAVVGAVQRRTRRTA